VRRTITVQPVVLVWLRLLTPGDVGVFPALPWQRLLILAARLAGVGRLLWGLMRWQKVIIPSHILWTETFGRMQDPESAGSRG
jgi:hypothetical protein